MTYLMPLIGGIAIGVAAVMLLWSHGKIAGISGIVGGLLKPAAGDVGWRMLFLTGLLAGGTASFLVAPESFAITVSRSVPAVALAGLLVGFGTRLGNGCTSGHGVCGIGRLSPRSLIATATFIVTGVISVLVVRHLFGGAV